MNNKIGSKDKRQITKDWLSCFPEFNMVNFLQNERFKIHDERFFTYSKDERIQMVKKYHACLDELEELTMPLWGYGDRT